MVSTLPALAQRTHTRLLPPRVNAQAFLEGQESASGRPWDHLPEMPPNSNQQHLNIFSPPQLPVVDQNPPSAPSIVRAFIFWFRAFLRYYQQCVILYIFANIYCILYIFKVNDLMSLACVTHETTATIKTMIHHSKSCFCPLVVLPLLCPSHSPHSQAANDLSVTRN